MISITEHIDKENIKYHNAVIQSIRVSGARVSTFYNGKTSAYYSITFDTDAKYTIYCETLRRYSATIVETYRKPSLRRRVRSLFQYLCGSAIQSH